MLHENTARFVVISNPRHLQAVNNEISKASEMVEFVRYYASQPEKMREKLEKALIEAINNEV